jgi:hypothetical protein
MMMKFLNRAAAGLTLAMAVTVSTGCMENIALIGRPTLEEGEDDIAGEVERLDTSSRQIYLRASDSRTRVLGYSTDAQVVYRGRDYSVSQLEAGDRVAMQMKRDSHGNSYTDLIRVQESIKDRNQSRRGDAGPSSGIQTLDGRVEQLDVQRRSFEIRDQSREPVIVSLPSDAQRSDVERFRALRDGDYVRVEGRFVDRQRFELATFLRDNR